MKENLKIIFFGTPVFIIPALKELLDSKYNVVGTFTGNRLVEEEADRHRIKIFKPVSLKKDEAVFEQFKNLNPDICIVAAYGKIIPASYLKIPRYGFINIHPSILPKYRGPSPVQTAILNGDIETGISIMTVDKEVDHGPVLAAEKYKIPKEKYHDKIAEDLFKLGSRLIIRILPQYINGGIKPKEQDHSQATFTKKFMRGDGQINWDQPAEKIHNQIRALNPEPGTWTTWKSKILNIKLATPHCLEVEPLNNGVEPGIIKKVDNQIAIATKTCYLILKQIQLEGGKIMDAKAFLNGHPDFLSSKLR